MKSKILSLAVLALAAFNVSAQDAAEDLNGPTVACAGTLVGEPWLKVLADKVDVAPIPFAHMPHSPKRIATADERKAIARWIGRRDACFTAGEEYRVKTLLPEERVEAASLYANQRALAVELIKGNLTYDQYNRERFEFFKATQYVAGKPAAEAGW